MSSSTPRYVFLIEIKNDPETFEIRKSIDALHLIEAPLIEDETARKVALRINPKMNHIDSSVIHSMNLRKTFNADRLYGPLMVSLPETNDDDIGDIREMLDAYVSLLSGEELSKFIKEAKI